MDREKTVELSKQIYGITPFNASNQLQMLEEFLLEKGKEKSMIDLLIKILSHIPIRVSINYYVTAIEYYIAKYSVYKLSKDNKIILIY